MCKKNLIHSEGGQRLIGGVNDGILLMLGALCAVVGPVGYVIFRAYRKKG